HLYIADTDTRGHYSATQALQIAAALESASAHPLARAFRPFASGIRATDIVQVPGGGLQGAVGGATWRIGNREFVHALSLRSETNPDASCANDSDSREIFLGNNTGLHARFVIGETLRAGAKDVIDRLTAMRIAPMIASGDQPGPVAALAAQLGHIDHRAALLPEHKLQLVRELQAGGASVAAVGDGINDSPVLAGADVSIAMGSGTSVAQHSADCVWLGEQLEGLDRAFVVARKTMRIVQQNLCWALGYNLLAIPLAVTGSIAPWMAAVGMSASSLLVMLNALRLHRRDSGDDPGS
ncbi:MAG: HAD-IC family P-type ATPase, partial [Gammaproteobacteria bacterium]|nr:HAD-IC family P-type ATPase [Gammaproteobacteria bacterium]